MALRRQSPPASLSISLLSFWNPVCRCVSCCADRALASVVYVGYQDTLYGDQSEDSGSEVRFSVELTEISGLKSTYSLDIRRLKGPLRSYKYMYDSLRM